MKKYYVGLKSNNAICNENYFDGSITLYPTGEPGNIFYSSTQLDDISSEIFMNNYKDYLTKNISQHKDAEFVIFNKKIYDLCKNIPNCNIVYNDNSELLDFINNKFLIREFLKNDVNLLDYKICEITEDNYEQIFNDYSENLVIQGRSGSGGENTYLIKDKKLFKKLNLFGEFSISKYLSNTPLNVTMIIGKQDIDLFPISAQLIEIVDNRFKYVGGDFIYPQYLDKTIVKEIEKYSLKIAKKLKNEGYLGIMGIDYVLANNKVYFMEINPRFQSSSFLINLYLKKLYNMSLAELHTQAIKEKRVPYVKLSKIDYSFLNCNQEIEYDEFTSSDIIYNGYCQNIHGLIYRKLYNKSLIKSKKFERET